MSAPVYRVYSLRIRSPWPLPCERADGTRADLEFIRDAGALESAAKDVRGDWFQTFETDAGRYLRWGNLFEFLVEPSGRRVFVHMLPEGTPSMLGTYLLGQVVSFALLERGIESMHATVVETDAGRCVGICGDSGAGKSTLAASLLRDGGRLVTDDLMVLRPTDPPRVAQGPRRIKLDPRAAERLLPGRRGLPMNPHGVKRVYRLPQRLLARGAVPLSALFVLARGRAVRTRPLRGSEAFLRLAENTFNPIPDDERRQQGFLRWLAALASSVPVYEVAYPRRFDSLNAVQAEIHRCVPS